MTLDRSAMREAVSDVTIGFFMAFPIAFLVLSVTTWLELNVPVTAGVQTLVFTIVALVRKYFVRVHFKTRDEVMREMDR
jgi:uncharacterized membrane protein|tara:strand:+ start:425 stop:661 length:237 start_codon:yes stop_codon:yes gene_type:complete